MKTIFVTIFQGVEAKNILRTPILSTLLADESVRLVLLTDRYIDSTARVEYYKKEFQDDRLVYETVSMHPWRMLDNLFCRLKYTLLKTDTTDLKRMMARNARGSTFAYILGKVTNWLLARPIMRRTARFADFLFVREGSYVELFDKYSPDLVFLADLFGEREVHLLREAKRRGIRSVGLINSWDKVTSRCILRLLTDHFVVYNDIVRQELIDFNEVRPEQIFVGGIAQYDEYVSYVPKTREDFFNEIQADPKKKLMLYASMGKSFSSSEWEMIDLLHDFNALGEFGEDMEVLVRFQPNDFVDEAELRKRPHLKYDYPGIRFSSERGIDWDMSRKEVQHLADALHHADVLVSYTSSILIDAALFDTPIVSLNFTTGKHAVNFSSPMQYASTDHYKKAFATGGIKLASNIREFRDRVKECLNSPDMDAAGRRKLVETQCKFVDGKSGERIGNFLLSQIS